MTVPISQEVLSDLKRIKEKFGWDIEIYAWETTCSKALKQYAETNGHFINLEDFYYSVTYIKRDRDGIVQYYRNSKPLGK